MNENNEYEEMPEYEVIPDFDPSQTLKDIYSNDLEKQTNGLYSLTYSSGDYNLILTTLEKFIESEKWETRYTVFQCLMRFLELFAEIPIDKFLPLVINGFEDKNERVKLNVVNCFENFFYCLTPTWKYSAKEIKDVFKLGQPTDIVKTLMFINQQNWTSEKLSLIINKCLKHDNSAIVCSGGILLRLAYNKLHSQLSDFETSTKLANKLDKEELKYFNNEVYVMIDWIEEDMNKLKTKLKKHRRIKKSSH